MKKKNYTNRIVGIILSFLILSVFPAMAEDVTLNPIQPTTAGSFQQISWSSTGAFEPNASLELFNNGILDRIIVSETPLSIGSYYWAIPLSLQGLYQININATTTIGQELTNSTDIEITTPTADGCRYCHTTTGTNNSGYYDNTVGSVATRHSSLVARGVVNPITNVPFSCSDCHPIDPNNSSTYITEHNCLNCHNGTAFWANPLKINPGEPHLNIAQPPLPPPDTPPVIHSVTLSTNTPNTGDNILVTVNVTDGIPITSVTANGVSLTYQNNNIWNGSITTIEGTQSVNVSAIDSAGHITWDNSTSYTAITPNIIITRPQTGDKWVRGTTQTINWTYVGNLGNYATVELLEQGNVDQIWTNVSQSNGVGSLIWSIPQSFKPSTYQLRVSAGGYSNMTGNFYIVKK